VRSSPSFKRASGSSGLEIMLQRPISAIQAFHQEDGSTRLGLFSKLGPGITVQRCGEGFNDRTVKVRTNGQCYFVFVEDLVANGCEI
jgi:hypothetical protein